MAGYHAVIGEIASLIVLASAIPYLMGILKGTSTPSKVSWWIWALNDCAIVSTHFAGGGRTTFWVPMIQTVSSLAIAIILTVKQRKSKSTWTKLDKFCVAGSAASFTVWAVSGSALTGLIIGLVIDSLGAAPTLRNVWKNPKAENRLPWLMVLVAKALNLFAVSHWSFAVALYPMYAVVLSSAVTLPMLLPRRKSQ